MAAVFLIVSRSSGKALTRIGGAGTPVQQFTQGNDDTTQFWTLSPTQPGSQDFLIHPLDLPDLAITAFRNPGDDPTQPTFLVIDINAGGQEWRIGRIADPPYFFLLEGDNDLLMDLPGSSGDDGTTIQVFFRNENQNQQWTFLPA